MMRPIDPGAFKAAGEPADNLRLRKAADGLEAVFFGELMKAMRETVPEGGALDGGAGEEIFSGLLDSRIAELAAAQQHGGVGDALYRQLARLLESSRPPAGGEAK